ncbi:hypothetical protein M3N55_15695, partial [Roseibaca sp. V10]
ADLQGARSPSEVRPAVPWKSSSSLLLSGSMDQIPVTQKIGHSHSRETFLKQLSDRGYDTDRLNDIRRLVDAPDSDLFDVLGYVMFTNDPKTRHDRADAVKHSGLANLQEDMKALLIIILDAYERHGEHELATTKLGQFLAARYGSVGEAKNRLGGLPEIKDAFHRMQAQLYSN